MTPDFRPKSPLGKAFTEWHAGLRDDRGTRAELRRCDTIAAVVMTPEFHHLCRRWQGWLPRQRGQLDRLAAIIGLAAHIEHQRDGTPIARQMAETKGSGPVVSELRFRRLLQRPSPDELYPDIIRILHQLDQTANLHDLADSVYYWGDRVRKQWAYEYYGNLAN